MRILVKIGSNLIIKENTIDLHWLSRKISEITALHNEGHQIIIVSSGAVAAGMETRGITERPTDPLTLQLLSGQGQVKLIKYYKDLFMEKKIYIAQILLTHHNFRDSKETDTVSQIIDAYLNDGTVPVINENDMVNKEELEYERLFTDNDILSALVAVHCNVDLMLLLTNVDGLYAENPDNGPEQKIIPVVHEITPEIENMAGTGKSPLGLGGMSSKIKAARMVAEKKIKTIIANGRYPIPDIISGKAPGTHFLFD